MRCPTGPFNPLTLGHKACYCCDGLLDLSSDLILRLVGIERRELGIWDLLIQSRYGLLDSLHLRQLPFENGL